MPVNSRDVQFGAAIGFIVIVGIVAIYFGFSTKLILALLAGLGILFCASLVEGYVRAAMLGTGALLLLLIAYDLATSCDSACQQARAEATQQRAAQEQARMQAHLIAQAPDSRHCDSLKTAWHFNTTPTAKPINPAAQCDYLFWHAGHCIYVRLAGKIDREETPLCDGNGAFVNLPSNVEDAWSADTPFDGYVQLNPPRFQLGDGNR
jgi:hypothetical protein